MVGLRDHWTERHPDRHLWSPSQRQLARRMSQEAYEALYGRGPRHPPMVEEKSKDVDRGLEKIPSPPQLFRDVATRLGYVPPNELPRDPRPIPHEVELPPDSPPPFWDAKEDGGFDRARIREGFPDLRKLEIEPPPKEFGDGVNPEKWLDHEPAHGFTPDVVAYYLPWHIGGDDHWGIYFRERRMKRYIERIEREYGRGNMGQLVIDQVFWHEMEHFEQEKAATALEDLLGWIIYPSWLGDRHLIPVDLNDRQTGRTTEVWMIEEALATAREVEWARKTERAGGCPPGYSVFVELDSRRKSTGYNRFYLCLGGRAKQEARAAFLESLWHFAQVPNGRLAPGTAKILFGNRTWSRKAVPVRTVED